MPVLFFDFLCLILLIGHLPEAEDGLTKAFFQDIIHTLRTGNFISQVGNSDRKRLRLNIELSIKKAIYLASPSVSIL
jgi:hypothetical protein